MDPLLFTIPPSANSVSGLRVERCKLLSREKTVSTDLLGVFNLLQMRSEF